MPNYLGAHSYCFDETLSEDLEEAVAEGELTSAEAEDLFDDSQDHYGDYDEYGDSTK